MWRNQQISPRLNDVYNMVPIVILWFLWKRRNTIRHRVNYHEKKIFQEITNISIKFIKLIYHLKVIERDWVKIVDKLQSVRVFYSFKLIKWIPPDNGWRKGNTDCASKGNQGLSSFAFYIRDEYRDLVVAKGSRIKDTTSLEVEAIAIRECLNYCRLNSINQIIVKSDSWAMVQMLNNQWEISWSVVLVV